MTENVQAKRAMMLQDGEGAVVCTFVAIPVIWTGLAVPMLYCDICVRSFSFALGAAALVGLSAGLVREIVLGRSAR